MVFMQERYLRICCICCNAIDNDKRQVFPIKPTPSEKLKSWYGVCDCCQKHYPEILETFTRISELHEKIEDINHTIMFNLINSIKNYRNGENYTPKFRK